MLRRAGLRTLTLDVALDPARLGRALRALEPVASSSAAAARRSTSLGRLVYAVRSGGRAVEVLDYRGALPDTGRSTVQRLGEKPLAARDMLLGPPRPSATRRPRGRARRRAPCRAAAAHGA